MIDAPLGPFPFYPQLLDANLIDRLLLLTVPIVLGKGKRIFGNTSHQVALKLLKCEATPTGVIIATYERASAVPTGSV
jgi:dihydrofolate reductase